MEPGMDNGDLEPALVRAAQRGDRAAFEELVRRTARTLFARVYLETGDPHLVEDLVQETYLLAWRRLRTLDDPARFRPWIGRIAQSVVIDAARRDARKKRAAPVTGDGALCNVPDASSEPPEDVGRAELRDRALCALRSMPEEYRIPLTLRYLAGADYDAIARELALSNGSLRGLLHRGMKLLRERMKKD
jgi:RNA polymerase sigma-70 factor (ECF subfamily)